MSAHDQKTAAKNPLASDAFPLLVLDVVNGVSTPPRMLFGKMQWHDDLQFVVVKSGRTRIDTPGKGFYCGAGQAAFFNSQVLHRVLDEDDNVRMSFVFPQKLLGFFPGSEMEAHCVGPYTVPGACDCYFFDRSEPWHAEVVDHLLQAREAMRRTPQNTKDRYRACAQLVEAWSCFIDHAEPQIPSPSVLRTQGRMRAFLSFIEANYSNRISLEDIARAGSVSKAECSRCFKAVLQTSPYAYLSNYRISKSIELMKNTEDTLTEIARETGFSTSSHYSNAFKERMHVSPSAYMKACRARG